MAYMPKDLLSYYYIWILYHIQIRWDAVRSAVAGDYIIAVGSKLLAQTRNDEVVKVLAQVLADLVRGNLAFVHQNKDRI